MTHKRKALALATAISIFAIAQQAEYRATEINLARLELASPQQHAVIQASSDTGPAAIMKQRTESVDEPVWSTPSADYPAPYASGVVGGQASVESQMGPSLSEVAEPETQRKAAIEPRAKMSGPLAALAGGPGVVEVIVRYDEHPELFDDQRVAELGGEVLRSYEILDMRAIRIPAAVLDELAIDENIDWLSLDEEIRSSSVASREAANVPAPSTANAAYYGTGVGVAILDTGVNQHADLNENFRQYSFLKGNYPVPTVGDGAISAYNDSPRLDEYGHGTHVAGIISGSGVVSAEDDFKGSATNAHLLSLQVLGKKGGGSMSDVMAALDWLMVYGEYFDIRVVNLSLGKAITESNETDPMVIAVEKLWDAGIVVVVAAGNYGHHGSVTVTSPANSRNVITVGSLTDNGTGADFSDDYVSSFSSRGPTYGDFVVKPDLVAPGNRIVATIPKTSELALGLSQRLKACKTANCGDNIYLEMSGTSMATPLVAAAVTLMLEKDPTLTPATVKARLMRSARKVGNNFTASGAGLLDIDAAMNDAGQLSGQALSPLMFDDPASNGLVVEDTATLWGDATWASGYLYGGGFDWQNGYEWTSADGVTSTGFAWMSSETVDASGFGWTDSSVNASGFGWTDQNVHAKGFGWTDAQSLLVDDENAP